jgi:RNA polymerase sigma factor (sigma-70 family)
MYNDFFKELSKKKYDPLDPEEERKLLKRAQSGDRVARQELVNRNLRFIVKMAGKYRAQTEENFMDLVNAGVVGLLRAIDKYNISENRVRLLTFAGYYIFHEIYKELTKEVSMLYMPMRMRKLVHLIYQELPKLREKLGREPTLEELYDHFDGKYKLHEILFVLEKRHLVHSIQDLEEEDEREFLERWLPAAHYDTPPEEAEELQQKEKDPED